MAITVTQVCKKNARELHSYLCVMQQRPESWQNGRKIIIVLNISPLSLSLHVEMCIKHSWHSS